jgi:hypothetical protein
MFYSMKSRMFAALLSFALLAVGGSQPNTCETGYVWNGSECVHDEPVSCSGSTPYKVGNTCYSSCPSETYAYFSDCVSSCPDGTYIYNGNCVGGCPARTYNGKCVDFCPDGTYDYNNGCVDACPTHTIAEGTRCSESCPSGFYKYQSTCVESCPIEASYMYAGECRDECWKSGLYYESAGSKECVYSCPNVYDSKTNTCIEQCTPEQKKSGAGCYDKCPDSIPYADGDTCVLNCPLYIDVSTNNCVDVCPASTDVINGNRCEKNTPPTCNTNQYLGSDNVCYDNTVTCNSTQYINSNGTCVDYHTNPCPSTQYLGSDGVCHHYESSCPYYYNRTCVDKCPPETFNQYGQCVERCDSFMYRNGTDCVYQCDKAGYNGDCFDSCPREAPLNFYGKCLTKCPEGMWEKDGQCTYECPHFWLNTTCVERCPPTTFIVNEKYCYDDCPIGFKRDGQHCDMTNYTYPCSSTQTLSSDGHCVDFTYNYTNPCGADQWMLNNTCVPACKEGEFMDMNGNCMNPSDMCQRGLPGGVYNYDTNTCECPEGHWIQRDDSFVPPVVCARSQRPSSRINCPSFIPFTVYNPEIDNCICDAEHPVIISNPKDTFLPFACAVSGTETTIHPCEKPMYFDFMDGKCVYSRYFNDTVITITPVPTYTARPSYTSMPSACPVGTVMLDGKCQREIIEVSPLPSMCPRGTVMVDGRCKEFASQSPTVTRTAMPSRKPSASSTPTRSARPSNRPNSATSTPSASRTPKPSNRIFADVSRKPLPSIEFKPPPANVRRSPAPSAWPKKFVMEILEEERPPYIDAKVKLPGANVTEMSKPEKIQDMQASLACTLRMPLENIRITSISYVDDKGVSTKVDVDPTKFMMMGDGDIGCYSRNKTASGRRMLRQLQLKGAIHVDYSIIQPSDDILFMDTTQMNDVITNAPIMIELASSVGSSSIESSAVEASFNAAPSANPSGVVTSSTGTDSTFSSFEGYIGGGIAGVAVFGALVVGLIFYYKENKRNKRLLKEQKPKQIIVQIEEQIQNPMSVIQTALHHADSTRFDYGPETTRRSIGPLKTTHKSIIGSSV